MFIEITDLNFDTAVLQSPIPVMVHFWAEWSTESHRLDPLVVDVSVTYAGRAVIGKLNIDSNDNTPARYNVRSVPTLLFFKNGQLRDTIAGHATEHQMQVKIDALL